MAAKKFKRAKHGRSTATRDAAGNVMVRVILCGSNGLAVKGNISKTPRIEKATVSEVYAALDKFLFG